jgi:ribosome-associated protein YbcJ (S4-like RNA binding protein)
MRVPINVGSAVKSAIQYQDVGFNTPVSVRDGEKVVVGTTTMGDKGLVVVLITKFLK